METSTRSRWQVFHAPHSVLQGPNWHLARSPLVLTIIKVAGSAHKDGRYQPRIPWYHLIPKVPRGETIWLWWTNRLHCHDVYSCRRCRAIPAPLPGLSVRHVMSSGGTPCPQVSQVVTRTPAEETARFGSGIRAVGQVGQNVQALARRRQLGRFQSAPHSQTGILPRDGHGMDA